MRLSINLVFLSLVFVACGREHGSSGKKNVPMVPEEMKDILEQQVFKCRSLNGNDCPKGIGRLFILNPANPNSSAVCTGFLISRNRMLTNHHCVSSATDCANTLISIHTSAGPVSSRCREVLFTEANSEITTERSVDLTVMKIDNVLPPPYFTILSARQSPSKEVTAWVVDHVSLIEANITELNCRLESRQASFVLKNCPAISGNSGSPIVLKGTTRAFAIIWGSNVPPSVDASFPTNLRLGLGATSLATELFPFRRIINDVESSLH